MVRRWPAADGKLGLAELMDLDVWLNAKVSERRNRRQRMEISKRIRKTRGRKEKKRHSQKKYQKVVGKEEI